MEQGLERWPMWEDLPARAGGLQTPAGFGFSRIASLGRFRRTDLESIPCFLLGAPRSRCAADVGPPTANSSSSCFSTLSVAAMNLETSYGPLMNAEVCLGGGPLNPFN